MSKGSNQSSRVIAIGLMLFALFFGAGNLIFPSSMGQNAGYNVWWSVLGFIISGVGLPLAGVLAMGYSGCEDLRQLASRVGLKYGLVFSVGAMHVDAEARKPADKIRKLSLVSVLFE